VKFQVSAAMYMRSALLWDVTQHRLVVRYRRFGTTYRFHFQVSSSRQPRGLFDPSNIRRAQILKTTNARLHTNKTGSVVWSGSMDVDEERRASSVNF